MLNNIETERENKVRECGRLTTSEVNHTRLVIHREPIEDHVTRQGQGQSLAVEDRPIWRKTDKSVGDRDRVEHTGLQVPDEDVRRPETVELVCG